MREINALDVTAAVKRLCMEANSYLPGDVKARICAACENEPWDLARNILGIIKENFEIAEEKEFNIVRTKRFAVKPMSTEEAILQMNLLNHDFFVFRNSEDDSLCIVYQRKAGGYGLIVTDEEE